MHLFYFSNLVYFKPRLQKELKLNRGIPDNRRMILTKQSPYFALILLTFFGFTLGALSEDSKSKGLSLTQSDPLEVMIEKIPGFEERLEICQKPERETDLNECLWDGDAKLNLGELPEREKKAISDYLKFKKGEDDKRPEMKDTPLQMTEHIGTEKDPAIKSLEDYFSKKLQQALYGDVKKDLVKNVGKKIDKNKHKVVDQRVFHEVYENLVSKKIVSDISSYCIRVDYSDQLYLLANKEKEAIKQNQEKLSSEVEKHSKEWDNCFVKLQEICYDNSNVCNVYDPTDSEEEPDYNDCQLRLDKSHTKACAVMRSVRSARQALIANKHVMDVYEDQDKMSGSIALQHSNSDQVEVSSYDPNDEETSPDKITTFSSGEILSKENEFSAKNQEQVEKMEECYRPGENGKTGQIVDPEACEEFLHTNRKEQERTIAEVFVRGKAVSQQIKNMEEEDQVRDFLKEEGRSEDEIDRLVDSYDSIEELRAEINDRYEDEQKALIKEMSSLVDGTTAKGEEIDATNDLETIKKIHSELTQREETFKQMVHYNNVMASFLTIGSGGSGNDDEEQMRNTGMVIQEMNNSAFNPEVNEDYEEEEEEGGYFNQLTATLEETKSLEENESDATNVLLDVSKINEVILKYNRQPAQKEENQ